MEHFCHSSDGFLILRVQTVCVEAILISQSNFDRICNDIALLYHQLAQ